MPIFTAGYFNHNNIGGAQNTNRYHTKDAASFHLIAIILIAREGRRNDSYPGPFPPKLPVLVPVSYVASFDKPPLTPFFRLLMTQETSLAMATKKKQCSEHP